MHRLTAVLTALALAGGVAACGGDDGAKTNTTSAATTTTPRGYPTADDTPFKVQATIEAIRQVGGDAAAQDAGFVVLTAKATDGKTYKVLVPADVTLDAASARVLRDPACAGKILANLELVAAPAHETEGDSILVSAGIDTENC